MANTKSAKKMIRASERKRQQNRPVRSSVRTLVTKARTAIATDVQSALPLIQEAGSALDKAATKGVIHPNAAARRKSRLMRSLNKAVAAAAVAQEPRVAAKKAASRGGGGAAATAGPGKGAAARPAGARAAAKPAATKAPAARTRKTTGT